MAFSSETEKINKIRDKTNENYINLEINCCGRTKKSFQCQICEQYFKSRSSLQHHGYEHNDSKNFKCNFMDCGKAFKNPKRLSEHKRRTHFNSNNNFLCETCGYTTRFSHNLHTHARTHTPSDKTYCCECCGSCFMSLSELKEHLRVHRASFKEMSFRSYRCEECAVVFSSSKAFYHHRKLHLPSKSYVCNMCNATYSQAAGISQHYRWHKIQDKKGFASKLTIEKIE